MVDGATTAVVGARYTGGNRVGRTRWSRRNEILVADPARELAWRTVPTALYSDSTTWRITLQPAGPGTRITQTFEVTKLNPVIERVMFDAAMKVHRDRLDTLPAMTWPASARSPSARRRRPRRRRRRRWRADEVPAVAGDVEEDRHRP